MTEIDAARKSFEELQDRIAAKRAMKQRAEIMISKANKWGGINNTARLFHTILVHKVVERHVQVAVQIFGKIGFVGAYLCSQVHDSEF